MRTESVTQDTVSRLSSSGRAVRPRRMDMEVYRHGQGEFEKALAAVAPSDWDTPSTCPGWTVRDIAGHVTWAQRQLHAWTTGGADPAPSGGPGTPHPAAVLTSDDPLAEY